MPNNLIIIYFVSINPKRNWKSIISGQLNDLCNISILKNSHFIIVLTCENNKNLLSESFNFICNILSNKEGVSFVIDKYEDNKFEYHGIKVLYNYSIDNPDSIFLYIHSKGMYNVDNLNERSRTEKALTIETCTNWQGILNIFNAHTNIMRIGLFPDKNGIVWYNFFFARGSYLKTCENPIITDNRYYYENWLSTGKINDNDSYSLFSNNNNTYNPSTATQNLIESLIPKY
jgi:hypothetical protein